MKWVLAVKIPESRRYFGSTPRVDAPKQLEHHGSERFTSPLEITDQIHAAKSVGLVMELFYGIHRRQMMQNLRKDIKTAFSLCNRGTQFKPTSSQIISSHRLRWRRYRLFPYEVDFTCFQVYDEGLRGLEKVSPPLAWWRIARFLERLALPIVWWWIERSGQGSSSIRSGLWCIGRDNIN